MFRNCILKHSKDEFYLMKVLIYIVLPVPNAYNTATNITAKFKQITFHVNTNELDLNFT